MSQAQATNLSLGAAVQAYYCYSNNTLEDIMLLALQSLFSPFILPHGKSSSPEDLLSMYKFGLNVYNYPSKKIKEELVKLQIWCKSKVVMVMPHWQRHCMI